jgi:hypothetical protein
VLEEKTLIEELLPPKEFYNSTLDWVKSTGNEENLIEIYPEVKIPEVSNSEEHKIIEGKSEYSNKGFVVIAPGGRVLFDKAVISPDNKLLWDVSLEYLKTPEMHSIFNEEKLPPITITEETVAVLNHPAADNFYHWMIETLARIHLIQASNIKIDKYIINHDSLPFQLETLRAVGISEDRIIVPHNNFHLKAKKLIIPSFIDYPNAWTCKFVRDLLLNHNKIQKNKEYDRIYIARKKRRRVKNEQEILDVLNKYGFKSIMLENMTLQEQIEVFHSAKIVIGAHGAGLANLVFSEPGTKVIELFGSQYVNAQYWFISRHMNLDYRFIIESRKKVNRKRKRKKRRQKSWSGYKDMEIGIEEIMKKLEQ